MIVLFELRQECANPSFDEYFSKFTAQGKKYFWEDCYLGTLTVVRRTDRARVERTLVAPKKPFGM